MNERIAELMRSKGLHKYISEDCQHRMEMLAEMIVEECIRIMREQERIPKEFFYPKSADQHELAIRDYFGFKK